MLLSQIELPADAPPPAPHGLMAWLEQPHVKWAVPIPILIAIAPFIWLFFRKTWRELEEEAVAYRKALHDAGKVDYRPVVALCIGALILLMQDYYGGRAAYSPAYDQIVRPWLVKREMSHPAGWVSLEKYEELYALGWWA